MNKYDVISIQLLGNWNVLHHQPLVQSAHPAVQGDLVLKLLYMIMMFYWELVIILICLVRP